MPGIREPQRGKIRSRRPHPLERGLDGVRGAACPTAHAVEPPGNARILLVMYGPAADVKEKSFVQRLGTEAVMYPASGSRFPVSCGP
jgi:hypothetical protein